MSLVRSDSRNATQALLQFLKTRSRQSSDITNPDAPNRETFHSDPRTINEYFRGNHYMNTKELLGEIQGPKPSPKVVADHIPIVTCILARINKLHFIGTFASHQQLWDVKLPFDSEPLSFPPDQEDKDFYRKFAEHQWHFCPLKLTDLNNLIVARRRVLPITRLDEIGKGSTSTVQSAEWHYPYDNGDPDQNDAPNRSERRHSRVYAIKTYAAHGCRKNFEREWDAYQSLTEAGMLSAPGVVRIHAAFQYRETFHLMLEHAEGGTLENFLNNHAPPIKGEDIIEFYRSLFGTVKGLFSIHDRLVSVDAAGNSTRLVGLHRDLTPRNILCFEYGDSSAYRRHFKIADFGLTHFKRVTQGEEEDYTANMRAAGTLAPECLAPSGFTESGRQTVDTRSDIWSLGCIYDESATWVVFGSQGVGQYRDLRIRAREQLHDAQGGDCFHDGEKRLTAVVDHHGKLRSNTQPCDYMTGPVIITMIDEMLQKDRKLRPSAQLLDQKAENLLESADSSLQNAKAPEPVDAIVASLSPGGNTQNRRGPNQAGMPLSQTKEGSKRSGLQSLKRERQANGQDMLVPKRKPSNSPAFCSLQVARKWYEDVTNSNKTAKLPDHCLMRELQGREHLFFVDNSRTMRNHWEEMTRLAKLLVGIIITSGHSRINLRFLGDSNNEYKVRTPSQMIQRLRERSPDHMTSLETHFRPVLRDYGNDLERTRKHYGRFNRLVLRRQPPPKRSIYVFTDGHFEIGTDQNGKEAIEFVSKRLADFGLSRNEISVQFISFGQHEDGLRRLQNLDRLNKEKNLQLDIVDTEPSDGNVWKMLLGASNEKFDDDDNGDDDDDDDNNEENDFEEQNKAQCSCSERSCGCKEVV